MQTPFLPILSGATIQALDRHICATEQISSWQLMEWAALRAFEGLRERCGVQPEDHLLFLVGPGNNGGDAVALARICQQQGFQRVEILRLSEQASPDQEENWRFLPAGIPIHRELAAALPPREGNGSRRLVLVDGLFGVGLSRSLEGKAQSCVEACQHIEALKISLDIPSGLPADTFGQGPIFRAQHTLTFASPKRSLLYPEHAPYVGRLHVLDLPFRASCWDPFRTDSFYLTRSAVRMLHRYFDRFAHKGSYGKVLGIGGHVGMEGALKLTTLAALRTGSGLVYAASPAPSWAPLSPEVLVQPYSLQPDFNRLDAVAIGPGLGQELSESEWCAFLQALPFPVVLDADALNLLGKFPKSRAFIPSGSILTPHLKEFERLVGPALDQEERIQQAKTFAQRHDCVVVLKGAHTLIALWNGQSFFNSTGTPYMATAGSGDVLTGMLLAFLGMGYAPENAAICGVFYHGLAGELAGAKLKRGTLASDIIAHIPEALFADIEDG
ncbi:MAG: NAD(P)H-hydrate dehydratase [Nitritalea sp.]